MTDAREHSLLRHRAPLKHLPDVGAVRTNLLSNPTQDQALARIAHPRSDAAIIEECFRNLDEAAETGDWSMYRNLYDTYMGFPHDSRVRGGHPDLSPEANWRLMSSLRMRWLRVDAKLGHTPKEHRTYRDAATADAIRYWPANDRELETLSQEVIGYKVSKSQINRIRQTIPKEEQALYASEAATLIERVIDHDERLAEIERHVGLPQSA
jgi:hypothetical protein